MDWTRLLSSAVVLRVVLRVDEPASATFGLRMRVRGKSLGLDCPVVHEIEVDKEWTRRVGNQPYLVPCL
jgi:hypothetical protein